MKENLCYCGHDCSRCRIYLGTKNGDPCLLEESRKFYSDEFGIDLPLADFRCLGGRSDCVFRLCEGCPFRKCCSERGIGSCRECEDYPCPMIADYEKKYVNRSNQITAEEKTYDP